jgi:hypothetical protein
MPEKSARVAAAAAPASPAVKAELAAIDTLLGEFPGEKAEFVAQALTMEGMTSRLECQGMVRHRGPGQEVTGPIAVTLPVSVYVAEANLEHAREIVESVEQEDLIGEEWAAAPPADETRDEVTAAEAPVELETESSAAQGEPEDAEPHSEGVKAPVIIAIVAALLFLLFMLRR